MKQVVQLIRAAGNRGWEMPASKQRYALHAVTVRNDSLLPGYCMILAISLLLDGVQVPLIVIPSTMIGADGAEIQATWCRHMQYGSQSAVGGVFSGTLAALEGTIEPTTLDLATTGGGTAVGATYDTIGTGELALACAEQAIEAEFGNATLSVTVTTSPLPDIIIELGWRVVVTSNDGLTYDSLTGSEFGTLTSAYAIVEYLTDKGG